MKASLGDAGIEVVVIASAADGRINLDAALAELAMRDAIRVLVEGGGEIIGGLLDARRVDRVLAFVAPKLVGGAGARTPAGAAAQTSRRRSPTRTRNA